MKGNALPLSLAGLGVSWFVANQLTDGARKRRSATAVELGEPPLVRSKTRAKRLLEDTQSSLAEGAHAARHELAQTKQAARKGIEETKHIAQAGVRRAR